MPKDNVIPFKQPETSPDDGAIKFRCGGCDPDHPILELGPKDEIRVRGVLIERDYEVVEALRHFIRHGFVDIE